MCERFNNSSNNHYNNNINMHISVPLLCCNFSKAAAVNRFADYRLHCWTVLPVQEINIRACYSWHKLFVSSVSQTEFIAVTCSESSMCHVDRLRHCLMCWCSNVNIILITDSHPNRQRPLVLQVLSQSARRRHPSHFRRPGASWSPPPKAWSQRKWDAPTVLK